MKRPRTAYGQAWRDHAGLPLMAATCLAAALGTGCRAPWAAPAGALESGVPSFDRLIEIEQQSRDEDPRRNALSSRLRPGGRAAAAPPASPLSAASPTEPEAPADDSEFESMLADVPAAQRELLQRQAEALRHGRAAASRTTRRQPPMPERSTNPADQASSSTFAASSETPTSTAQEDAAITYRLSDGGDTATSDYSPSSKYAVRPQEKVVVSAEQMAATRRTDSRSESSPNVKAASAVDEPVVLASAQSVSAEAETDSWRDLVRSAIDRIDNGPPPASPEEHVRQEASLRMLHLALGELGEAMEPIEGMQTEGQDFIRHSFQALHEATDPAGNPIETKRYTLAMMSQRKAMQNLAEASSLEVANVAFCTDVEGFGVVKAFPKNHFQPDQEVLLYCEIDNFVSEPLESKGFETQLQGSYEIIDSNGRRVANQTLPMDTTTCRSRRRDYFIAYRIYMPQSIEPGQYELRLVIEDIKGRKFGQADLPFEITQ